MSFGSFGTPVRCRARYCSKERGLNWVLVSAAVYVPRLTLLSGPCVCFSARPCTYCDAQFSWLLWYTAAQGRRKNLHFLLQSVFFDWCTYIRHNYIHNQCFSQVSKNVLRLWSFQLDIISIELNVLQIPCLRIETQIHVWISHAKWYIPQSLLNELHSRT